MSIGERIKERREALRMSQDELAQKVGYRSRSSINKIEMNKADVGQKKISQLAKALDTTEAFLMGWKEEPYVMEISDRREVELINAFRLLNESGKTTALTHIDFLRSQDSFTKDTASLTGKEA